MQLSWHALGERSHQSKRFIENHYRELRRMLIRRRSTRSSLTISRSSCSGSILSILLFGRRSQASKPLRWSTTLHWWRYLSILLRRSKWCTTLQTFLQAACESACIHLWTKTLAQKWVDRWLEQLSFFLSAQDWLVWSLYYQALLYTFIFVQHFCTGFIYAKHFCTTFTYAQRFCTAFSTRQFVASMDRGKWCATTHPILCMYLR